MPFSTEKVSKKAGLPWKSRLYGILLFYCSLPLGVPPSHRQPSKVEILA